MIYNTCTLVVVGVLSLALSSGVLAGDFAESCTGPDGNSFLLSGTKLKASCKRENGQFKNTSIDLNRCIVNNLGKLACQKDGEFGASCGNCNLTSVEPTVMECMCKPNSPDGNGTFIDLNTCVGNNNGDLVC